MTSPTLHNVIEEAVETLPYRRREVYKLRSGMGDGFIYSTREVAMIFKRSSSTISREFKRAREEIDDILEEINVDADHVTVSPVLEQAKELTPYLISHLKSHSDDLRYLPWQLFEHLIAEFFASWSYEDVKIIGRNPETGADIVAMRKADDSGVIIRYFIEVKRWKDTVGVEVVDRVLGAMLAERQKYGWHLGMIVTTSNFSDIVKYTPSTLSMLGIELRNGNDVKKWLSDYKFKRKGLWLPNPFIDIK